MSTILALTSSALGSNSVSNQLVNDVLGHLQAEAPDASVIHRDLDADPVPHLVSDTVAAFGAPANANQSALRELSDTLLAELAKADTIVIGSPMYNFGITSTLKAWFDHVLRAGITFRYTESGSEGLLKGKRAIVAVSRGGIYGDAGDDFQVPHLRTLLAFMGINDITFIRAERLAFGPELRAQSIEAARAEVVQVMTQAQSQAA